MSRKITRMSLTLPEDLLGELDRMLKVQGYASRSEAVRDALRDFLANYKWRQKLKGELVGVVTLVYEHDVRGLTDALMDIQHAGRKVVNAVQHLHLDTKNCLETLVVRGQADEIRKLVDRLGALRGVKQVKLMTIG
jgi:CopG family nickel-responsive transcriptional regulator